MTNTTTNIDIVKLLQKKIITANKEKPGIKQLKAIRSIFLKQIEILKIFMQTKNV